MPQHPEAHPEAHEAEVTALQDDESFLQLVDDLLLAPTGLALPLRQGLSHKAL